MDATDEQFEALIDKHAAIMNDDGMLEMRKEITQEKENGSGNDGEPDKVSSGLTSQPLAELMRMARNVQSSTEDWDHNMHRSMKVQNGIQSDIDIYSDMLKDMKKCVISQLSITMFLTPHKKLVQTLSSPTTIPPIFVEENSVEDCRFSPSLCSHIHHRHILGSAHNVVLHHHYPQSSCILVHHLPSFISLSKNMQCQHCNETDNV